MADWSDVKFPASFFLFCCCWSKRGGRPSFVPKTPNKFPIFFSFSHFIFVVLGSRRRLGGSFSWGPIYKIHSCMQTRKGVLLPESRPSLFCCFANSEGSFQSFVSVLNVLSVCVWLSKGFQCWPFFKKIKLLILWWWTLWGSEIDSSVSSSVLPLQLFWKVFASKENKR